MAKLHLAQQILDIIYPVGSIYLSTDFTNPSKKFGGTWVQVSGGYLYAAAGGSGITKGNHSGPGNGTAIGSTAITIDQMPAHNHIKYAFGAWGASSYNRTRIGAGVYVGKDQGHPQYEDETNSTTSKTGGGKGHTHSIDLVDCYMWKRIN